jgi:hypothetical protein
MAPITAKFEADFASFYEATQKAVVELDSMEKGAARAESKLQSMADRFSGEKVIQQAQVMTEAIERLGGVSTLTEKELEQVGRVTNEAVEKMRALGLDVPKGMQAIADATKGASTETESLGVKVSTLVASYLTYDVAVRAVTAAYDALVGGMAAAITSASDAEEADAKLLAALKAQGTAVPSVVSAYDAYAQALQNTTIYSDDAVKAAEGVLVMIGGVMPRDMEKALQATTNLASALGIDLTSAATMVAKAAEGQTTALKKAGVVIDETKSKSGDFGAVLDQINGKFAGAAEAAGETFAGGLKKLENAWDNVKEATGRVVTQNETWQAAMAGITGLIATNTGELNQNATANKLVSEAVILVAQGFGLAVSGLDYFQQELHKATVTTDFLSIGLFHFYELLQKIEIATQKPIALLGGEDAIRRVKEAGDALEWAGGAIQGLRDHQREAEQSSKDWSATLQTFRGEIDTLVGKLEATRGGTVALTASQAESKGVWEKTTGAISAQQMALDEQKMAMEGSGDAWGKAAFKIDAAATAIAKSIDATVMAAAKAAASAADLSYSEQEKRMLDADKTSKAYYDNIAERARSAYAFALAHQEQYTQEALKNLYEATEKADRDAANWSALANEAMQSVTNGANATAGAIDGIAHALTTAGTAMTSFATQAAAAQSLTSEWIDYAYSHPESVARGTLGQTFLVNPSTGSIALQGMAAGGPVAGGSTVVVGEKGPELFTPGTSGMITPNGGGGGGVRVEAGAIVLNYPIVDNPQAMDHLARIVGDALLSKMTRSGARL